MRTGKRRFSRWLFGYSGRLPRSIRVAFFLASLIIVGGIFVATESEGLQIIGLYGMVLMVLPMLSRRFARVDEHSAASDERRPPVRVIAVSFLIMIAWATLIATLAPDLGLGPWFWPLVVLWPWLEVDAYLGERSLRRDGVDAWRAFRPLRDPLLTGVAMVPLVVAILLVQGESARSALTNGLACGVIVALIGYTIVLMMRRSSLPERTEITQ